MFLFGLQHGIEEWWFFILPFILFLLRFNFPILHGVTAYTVYIVVIQLRGFIGAIYCLFFYKLKAANYFLIPFAA